MNNPSKPLHITTAVILILHITLVNSTSFQPLYNEHCHLIVPASHPIDTHLPADNIPRFAAGFFTGGDKILSQDTNSGTKYSKSVYLRPHYVSKTEKDGILGVQASLYFSRNYGFGRFSRSGGVGGFGLRAPRIPVRNGGKMFRLDGFWSESTGKLCMVGSDGIKGSSVGGGSLSVVLKLDFPVKYSVLSSLVNGSLESVDRVGGLSYFEPVSILGVVQSLDYEFTLVDKEIESGGFKGFDDGGGSLGFSSSWGGSLCRVVSRSAEKFKLEYGRDCDNGKCNPLGEGVMALPSFMSFLRVNCPGEARMAMLIRFHNDSSSISRLSFDPGMSMIAEGVWDGNKKKIFVVACKIKNVTNSVADPFVRDCSTRLALRFPETLSIRNRSTIVGQIWSNKSLGDSGYFGKIPFQGVSASITGFPGLKYKFSQMDRVRKSCAVNKAIKHNSKKYPNGYSSDMQFGVTLRNGMGQQASGYLSPLFVEHHFYGQYLGPSMKTLDVIDNGISTLLNVSYKLTLNTLPDFVLIGENMSSSVEIAAEGTYDTTTGKLCMVGCRQLGSFSRKLLKDDVADCEILINIQFTPLNAQGHVKGSIESTRRKSDPLYFNRVELSSNSIYTNQAAASIWRMDMEIALVIISNTLSCVFVGLQILHMKRNPDMLPLVSLLMLILLTLGHLIPLLLNFEAFFANKTSQRSFFLESGGWLEVNEVIVRLVTMIAFLFHFWLLQLVWSARRNEVRQQSLWAADKKVVYVTLSLYMSGGLIAWFVHLLRKPSRKPFMVLQRLGRVVSFQPQMYQKHSVWSDLRSYAGLLLDSFLLPQIIFNIASNSKEKALSAFFYIGVTFVRLLPHAYDFIRAHTSPWSFDSSYIFADHKLDYYSTGWDIIIICGGIVLASLIYLQQRSGGHFILPKKLRERFEYELVPVANGQRSEEAPQ